jgi:hypothetical protein
LGFSVGLIPHSRSFYVPPSVHILQIISDILLKIDGTLDITQTLTPEDISKPQGDILCLFQGVCLASLSLHGGVLIPSVKKIDYTFPTIKIYWASGIKDQFDFGKADEPFLRFFAYLQKKLWKRVIHTEFSLSVFYELILTITRYCQQLTLCNTSIETVLSQDILDSSLSDLPLSLDIYFLIISSLPVRDLNAFFLFLHHFLPDNLFIKQDNGTKINAAHFFQTSSEDIHFLMQKIDIYLRLFSTPDTPILQVITQQKTKEYLSKLLMNKESLNQVRETLTHIREQQILTRLRLYCHITDVLSRLLKL